jgi:23S rRNA pseudouridine2605 synthase
MIRINKHLAHCGVASRRKADAIVLSGRVTVNGVVVTTLGQMIDETADDVKVDGVAISPAESHHYLVLNKPAGVVTSLSDPHHERTVMDLVAGVKARVYPVGRLDLDTEGVLLFTDDGELAHRLTHPRYGIQRVYHARVKGEMPRSSLEQFARGITLPDGAVGRADVTLEKTYQGYSSLILTMTEGRKREVKHLCKAVGYPVVRLVRKSFAGIDCGDLQVGRWRYLTPAEISRLKRLVEL